MSQTAGPDFGHLPPAAAGLGHIFARPKVLAALCVVALAGLGWFYLAFVLVGMGGSFNGLGDGILSLMCRPRLDGSWTIGGIAIIASMWGAMTLAMMLPSAAPMIMTYAGIADTAARKNEPIVSPFVLAGGYMAVWFTFSVIAALLQMVFARGCIDRREHDIRKRVIFRRDLYRRWRLSVLETETRLPYALPASVPIFIR